MLPRRCAPWRNAGISHGENMNVERINQLADHLERDVREVNFSMLNYWFVNPTTEYCGTPACVAGHTVALFGGSLWYKNNVPRRSDSDNRTFKFAAELLGLDEGRAQQLFCPDAMGIAKSTAVSTLRGLAENGRVHWSSVYR